MEINDSMLRESSKARHYTPNDPVIQGFVDWFTKAACILAMLICSHATAFMWGSCWQSRRHLQCSLDFSAWIKQINEQAERDVRKMSNYELVKTDRKTETDNQPVAQR